MRVYSLLVLSLVLAGCGVGTKTASKQEAQGAPNEEQGKKDAWERMRECAERADLMARREGWAEGRRRGDVTIIAWENHYSPKYGRCYVRLHYKNNLSAKTSGEPPFYTELYDAFEGVCLAMCADQMTAAASLSCAAVGDNSPSLSSIDCPACRKFIDDRMNK